MTINTRITLEGLKAGRDRELGRTAYPSVNGDSAVLLVQRAAGGFALVAVDLDDSDRPVRLWSVTPLPKRRLHEVADMIRAAASRA